MVLTACTVNAAGGSAQDMFNSIMNAPLIRCDVPNGHCSVSPLRRVQRDLSLGAAAVIITLLFPGRRNHERFSSPCPRP